MPRGVTTSAAQLRLAERKSLGLSAPFLEDKPEKIAHKLASRDPERPLHLCRATAQVKDHTRKGRYEMGWALYQEVEAAEADTPLKNSVLNLCAKAAWFERGRSVWETIDPKSQISYGTMIDLCARCQRLGVAENVFRGMGESGVQQDIIAFNAMVNACGMCGQPQKALDCFNKIPASIFEQASPENKQVAYQTVMIALARSGDYARAREVFMGMTSRGVSANCAHFNALLVACADAEDAATAQQVFDLMPGYGVTPNVANWTILLSCYRSDLPRCLKIMQDMEAAGVQPSGSTRLALLEAHVLARDGAGARALLAGQGQLMSGAKLHRLTRQAQRLP
uniref:PROP1-like PPR domain-containing protein n=1 Tax=Alexandrium catenella TaxID=2925 RepID=A0A7S1PJX9_ALECA